MAIYQQGLLALHKMRQNGQQRITVQYVNVSNGSQAVIGKIERDGVQNFRDHPPVSGAEHRLDHLLLCRHVVIPISQLG